MNSDSPSSATRLGPHAGNPTLKRWQLTILLIALAVVPSVATVGIWSLMPGVQEGQLPVEYQILGMPNADYYQLPATQRPPLEEARIVITNRSDKGWDLMNVRINSGFEVRDTQSKLGPGESKEYDFSKFYDRAGFTFDPELSPITRLRVFARVDKTTRQSIDTQLTHEDYNHPILSETAQAKTGDNIDSEVTTDQ